MKSCRVLVVEDDERVMPSVEDALFSLGHEHDWVTNQADAQERFGGKPFDYVLLDLQIPARAGRGGASIDCGLNLLRWMRKREDGQRPPVIIMTGQTGACVDLTRELTENDAREFIAKHDTSPSTRLTARTPDLPNGQSRDYRDRPGVGLVLAAEDDPISSVDLQFAGLDIISGDCRTDRSPIRPSDAAEQTVVRRTEAYN